jgi:hypothetical protein
MPPDGMTMLEIMVKSAEPFPLDPVEKLPTLTASGE